MVCQMSHVPKDIRTASGLRIPEIGFCEVKNRLQGNFLSAIRELNSVLAEQTQAVIDGDSDFERFDVLIHMAQEKKEAAKYAWIAHVESHQCDC
jgi:hypothetical protein